MQPGTTISRAAARKRSLGGHGRGARRPDSHRPTRARPGATLGVSRKAFYPYYSLLDGRGDEAVLVKTRVSPKSDDSA
jgi:hypothetical protein